LLDLTSPILEVLQGRDKGLSVTTKQTQDLELSQILSQHILSLFKQDFFMQAYFTTTK